MKRTLITLLAVAVAIGISVAFMSSNDRKTPVDRINDTNAPGTAPGTPAPTHPAIPENPENPAPLGPPASAGGESATAPASKVAPTPAPLAELSILEAPLGSQPEPVLGSDENTNDNPDMMRVKLTSLGAGVQQISLARYSEQALRHIPYIIQQKYQIAAAGQTPVYAYPLEARGVVINGRTYSLDHRNWFVTEHDASHAVFQLTLAEHATSSPILQITRTYRLAPGSYDLQLDQQLTNLSDKPLDARLVQLGQVDMTYEPGYMGDKRAVILGYFQPNYDPARTTVFIDGFDLSRLDVMNKPEHATLWPTEAVAKRVLQLSFVAGTNRYFATAIHAPVQTVTTEAGEQKVQPQLLDALFPTITRLPAVAAPEQIMSVEMTSRALSLAPGASGSLDLNLFAGPKSPAVIRTSPAYTAVGLDHLIIYNLGGCCAFLTFGWLAKFMLAFLTFIHSFLFDWGIAIILLVLIVRAILHPVTKKSQLNMMKFSRQMQSMAPELEKLKKKYADDKNKLNAETMKLYRDKGVNPAAMGAGCLPMLLQMPIWYALYAMLFYAIELRHQPAFYNVFHNLAAAMGVNWSFLTDLSAADHFIMLGNASFTIPLLGWHVDAVNLLPLLMGVVFYFQQKYTTMAPANNGQEMTDQQKTQMKMMKFMIFLFPVFLYKAPAGLNLYILASTAAGIVDSKIVRNHLKELEAKGELDKPAQKKQAKPGGLIDRLQKAAEAKRKQMEQAQRQGNKKPRSR